MKKRILFIFLSCVLALGIIFLICFAQNTGNKEDKILKYLETKYKEEFIITSQIKECDDETCVCAYNVSPIDNPNLTFIAGQKKEKNIFPFLPPIDEKVFFDDYFEKAKKYVISNVITNELINVNSADDINVLSASIYNYMKKVNNELEKMGFETTKFTCSMEFVVYVNQKPKEIDFYILDETVIHDLLIKAYYE